MFLFGVASAQPVITSGAPDKIGVTIYRDPNRSIDGTLNIENLQGFALISETRTVDLPPGVVTIRFEGVASGIVPQSALIFGAAIREKNRDAALLSERSLLDAFTGQRVILRRNNPVTGMFTEEIATIRSGTAGVVVQTAKGFEPIYCSGLSNDLIFPNAPTGLSAKPTLSMTTKDQPGGRRTITLVYLSQQFDWQANYVGEFSADASELNLFAWLTMASSDDTSFVDAQAAAIAGKVNREGGEDDNASDNAQSLDRRYNCWPSREAMLAPPPVMAPAPMEVGFADGDIVVTAMRREALSQSAPMAVTAVNENLGDLKLYRIPVPVTVAARAQKQVAFLVKPRVKGAMIYRVQYVNDLEEPEMLFRFKNSKANGLGEPLPAGKVALFQQGGNQRFLVGEASIADKANEEDVDLVFGSASNVTVEAEDGEAGGKNWQSKRLTIRNASPMPIRFEAEFPVADESTAFSKFTGKMLARPGKLVWTVTVPANGTSTLDWSETEKD